MIATIRDAYPDIDAPNKVAQEWRCVEKGQPAMTTPGKPQAQRQHLNDVMPSTASRSIGDS